ncbi:MAG: TRAP transporter small permease [Desulfotalea sp.]
MSQNCNDNTCKTGNSLEIIDIFNSKKNWFDKIVVNGLASICLFTSVALTLIMCGVTFVRYVIEGDLYGFEEWVKLLAFWLYFSGAAIGAYNRTHVSADLVNAYLEDGILKRSLVFLRCFLTVASCLLFAWYGWEFFYFGFMGPLGTGIAIPKTSAWRIPLWTGYLSVFLGLSIMVYYFTRDLILSGIALFRGGKN